MSYELKHHAEIPQFGMGVLALVVGIIAGFGAIVFRMMIGAVHNFLFFGKFSFFYNANFHTPPSSWGWLIIFVPVVGAVVVSFLITRFALEARGTGIPEVMESVYLKGGIIRPIVIVIKSIASAISIGSGGSVGREGPIVQIGSAFGSMLGQIVKMPVRQRNILIAAGAAGGIAATFNTPIGALAFGIELMLASITAASLFPVAVATVTATYIGRTFLGSDPSFYIRALIIPHFHLLPLSELAIFVPFGVLLGICAVIFIRGIYWCEDGFKALPDNYYIKHMAGMLLMGIMMYSIFRFAGHYYVQGIGYATITDILRGALTNPWFLLLLLAAKLLSTCLTLGSGASGGIFSPSLFLGATLGGAFGLFLQTLFPGLHVDPIVFALAGMAGMVGSTTGAVMTGAIMVIEMTSDNNFVLPIIITVTTAYAIRKLISSESIFTLKLARKGAVVPEGLQSAVMSAKRARDVMNRKFRLAMCAEIHVTPEEYFTELEKKDPTIVVDEQGKIEGVFTFPFTQNNGEKDDASTYVDTNFLIVVAHAPFPNVLRMMKIKGASYAIVTSPFMSNKAENVVGIISERDIFETNLQSIWLLQ